MSFNTGPLAAPDKSRPSLKITARSYSYDDYGDDCDDDDDGGNDGNDDDDHDDDW